MNLRFFEMLRVSMVREVFFLFVLGVMELSIRMFAKSGGVFGTFLCRVGLELRAAGGTARFHFGGFFRRKTGDRFGGKFFRCGALFFVLLATFEFRATNEGIYFSLFGSFFVFGLDEICGQCGDLIVAELSVRVILAGVNLGFLRHCSRGSFFRSFGNFLR